MRIILMMFALLFSVSIFANPASAILNSAAIISGLNDGHELIAKVRAFFKEPSQPRYIKDLENYEPFKVLAKEFCADVVKKKTKYNLTKDHVKFISLMHLEDKRFKMKVQYTEDVEWGLDVKHISDCDLYVDKYGKIEFYSFKEDTEQ